MDVDHQVELLARRHVLAEVERVIAILDGPLRGLERVEVRAVDVDDDVVVRLPLNAVDVV